MTFLGSVFHDESSSGSRVRRTSYLSIAVHLLLLGFAVLGTIHAHHVIILNPTSRGSATPVSIVAVNRGALASILAAKAPPADSPTARPQAGRRPNPTPSKLDAKLTLKSAPEHDQRAVAGRSAAEKTIPGMQTVGTGDQNMYPAYPVVSPSPQVRDRSLLPPTDRSVVVDVNLSSDGHVQDTKLVSGLGNNLDQLVLDTVRGWEFHPAMLNGAPVASSIELVFPFNRNYPIAE